MTHFLYMVRPRGMDVCKIGETRDMVARRLTLQSGSPTQITLERVLVVESKAVAKVYESWVAANAKDAHSHGEWFVADQHIHDLFDAVTPAVDVTADFAAETRRWPRYRDASDEWLEENLAKARGTP